MMKKKIHAKKKIQGKKVPGARRFPQNCAKLTKKKYWCLPRHDSHDSSFCGNPKLQWLAQISRCQKNQITGDDGNGIQNEYWVTQQNDYFIAKSQPYALAHCSRELQNLEAHEQNVRELSLSQTHRAYKSTNLMRGGGPVNSPDHI